MKRLLICLLLLSGCSSLQDELQRDAEKYKKMTDEELKKLKEDLEEILGKKKD